MNQPYVILIRTMIKGIFQNTGILFKIFQLISVVFVAIIIMTVLVMLFTNGDSSSIITIKQMQLIQSLCLFVAVPFTLAFLWSSKPLEYLKFRTKTKFEIYFLVTIIMFVAIPFINLIGSLNQQISLPESLSGVENWMRNMETQLQELTIRIVNVNTIKDLVFNLFLIAIIAGLGEELMFRGIIQRIFSDWKNAILAIWLAAFIFSAIHMQFYGFFPRFLLGALFGYFLMWTNNIWVPILAHTLNNGIAVVFYYLKFNGYNVINIDTIGTGNTTYIGIISAVFTAVGIFFLYKLSKKQSNFSV